MRGAGAGGEKMGGTGVFRILLTTPLVQCNITIGIGNSQWVQWIKFLCQSSPWSGCHTLDQGNKRKKTLDLTSRVFSFKLYPKVWQHEKDKSESSPGCPPGVSCSVSSIQIPAFQVSHRFFFGTTPSAFSGENRAIARLASSFPSFE